MSSEKQSDRDAVERMAKRLKDESRGSLTYGQAKQAARRAARYVVDGKKQARAKHHPSLTRAPRGASIGV